ncbi:glycosyl transferase family 2 [Longispora fulva]|uniref:Glycosyltransferase involved in cell wall biosynthesis n=1 Tax=Longispora fulva TaxID=619741 RepID=A0A8J7GK67_9ACTN|nr:glycosyltransferase family 2 protein [Longispora fulva]MBG6138143.1 glycosyltransferase involved in cell wall biosynthesis [Longispora fulva]GIG60396.1 glycosyl transferase family 2 [Longispora fulva]
MRTPSNRVLIIMPAWNEAEAISAVIKEIHAELPGVDVLVVDDGSGDNTAAVAGAAGASVLRLPYNLGVGGAMRLGYRYARDNGYDITIQVDADGQHDPRFVPELIAGLEHADLIIGARFAGVGAYQARGPRRWAMGMLGMVISRLARTKLTDTTSGLRCSNRKMIEYFADWYPVEYLGDTIETLVRAIRDGHTVRQVPVEMRPRQGGVPSHSPLKATVYLGRAFVILLLALIRR